MAAKISNPSTKEVAGKGQIGEDMKKQEGEQGRATEAADGEIKYRIRLRNFLCCQCQGLAASSNFGVTCFRCRHEREHCDSCSKGQSHFLPVSENPYNSNALPWLGRAVRAGGNVFSTVLTYQEA